MTDSNTVPAGDSLAGRSVVVTECDLPEAPEKVWKALTTPELLAKWLPEATDCEVLAAEPNRLLRYRWRAGEEDRDAAGRELDSVVTFELTDTPSGGTHLRVAHRLLVAAPVISLFRTRHEPTALACGTTTTAMLRAA
jgi:uncharacterized protein YndB with AHSA1/START domain